MKFDYNNILNLNPICGGGNKQIHICKNDRIVVPTILKKYVVNWYHKYLLHMGEDFTGANISHNYYWPNLRYEIRTHIEVCKTCHKNKKQNLKCGKLAANEA